MQMKNRILFIFLSISMFYMTYKIIVVKIFPMRGMIADFNSPFLRIFAGVLFFVLGILFLFLFFKRKPKTPQYTKCPNCKEVFNYNELKDGKCKNCKDVKTVDLEEYFKKYPEELEDKER